MKTRLLAICSAVAITLNCAVMATGVKDKTEKDWAQFSRYEEMNKSLTKSPAVVFMGNSITDNWAKMRPDFFKKHNIAGRGISGQVSSQMLVRFQCDVVDLHPKAVVILSGTNDIAKNNGTIELKHVFRNIVSMCQLAQVNGITPVLASLLPCSEFYWIPSIKPSEDIKTLNGMIKEYAEKNGFAYVDYYAPLTDENGGLPKKYSNDGVHPNTEAYEIMEHIVLKSIEQYLK